MKLRDEPRTRAILFDAGNTLVYVDPARMVELFRAEGADVDVGRFRAAELEARRRLHEAITGGRNGSEPEVWGAYFSGLYAASGLPPEAHGAVSERVREVHEQDHLWTWVEPGTEETLTALARAGYRLAVISNADGRMEALLERVGLARHFEFVVDSEVFGVEKPDPSIFLEGVRRMELPEEACIYVGDLYAVDYLGAAGAGLKGVLLDPLGMHEGRAPRIKALGNLPGWLAR